MRKTLNREHIEGRIYDHSLAFKKVQNPDSANHGKDFIGGTIDIATDEEGLNVVTVNYTYITEFFSKSGKKDSRFTALKNIIENGKTILADGKDAATMVKIDPALALNDFYTNRNGEETLVSAKRNESGFINIVTSLDKNEKNRSTFEMDMLINGTEYVEADEEKHIKADYLKLKGAVFAFNGAILPVEFVVKDQGGIKFFEGLDASPTNLFFTKVWGNIENQTIVTRKEEESAFGEPSIKEYTRNIREWVVTGAKGEGYEIGDAENGITEEEIKKAMADRNIYLADVKKRQDEYNANKDKGTAAMSNAASAPAQAGGFNF